MPQANVKGGVLQWETLPNGQMEDIEYIPAESLEVQLTDSDKPKTKSRKTPAVRSNRLSENEQRILTALRWHNSLTAQQLHRMGWSYGLAGQTLESLERRGKVIRTGRDYRLCK